MNVLVICAQYAPDRGPAAPIFTGLCEDLVKAHYDVDVICGFPHNGGDVWPEYRRRFYQRERLNGVNIHRVYVFGRRKKLWQRLLYHVSINLTSALAALITSTPDIVIAPGPSLWTGLPVLLRGIVGRRPYIYPVYDIYPDIAVQLGFISNPLIVGLIEKIEKFYYRHARYVSVLAEGMKQRLIGKGVAAEKIEIIPPCVDTDFIKPLERESRYRAEWQLGEKFVILYAGNIGLSQGLDTVLRMADLLRGYPDIAVVLAGDGMAKDTLQETAAGLMLTNTRFFPAQERDNVPDLFGLADVSLVSLNPTIIAEAVPSKTYSIMASGRPMVATAHGDSATSQLLDAAQCGLHVTPGDPHALAEAVIRLYHDESQRKCMAKNGRDFVVEHYSRKVATRLYEHLINNCFSKEFRSPAVLPCVTEEPLFNRAKDQ